MAGLSQLAPAEGLFALLTRLFSKLTKGGGHRNAHFKIETEGHTYTRTFWLFNKDMKNITFLNAIHKVKYSISTPFNFKLAD